MSPSSPKSSASAERDDALRPPDAGGSNSAHARPRPGAYRRGARTRGACVAAQDEATRAGVGRLREVGARVRAARLFAGRARRRRSPRDTRSEVAAPRTSRRSRAGRSPARPAEVAERRRRACRGRRHRARHRSRPTSCAGSRRGASRDRWASAVGSTTGSVVGISRPRARARRSSRRSIRGRSCRRAIASTTRRPNTSPSSSEFDARRFAPCTPLHAASPHDHRCGSVVAPSRSVTTPPER